MLMRLALVPTAEVADLVREDNEDAKSSGHYLYAPDVQVDLV